jgi:hypothetical protein
MLIAALLVIPVIAVEQSDAEDPARWTASRTTPPGVKRPAATAARVFGK